MKDIIKLLHEPDTTIAIVGATDNPNKFGNRIYLDLKSKGFQVYPVNRNRKTVANDQVYASVKDIPEKPTIVDFVIHPQDSLEVLHECLEHGLMNVFMQPGSESPDVLEFLKNNHFSYVVNDCIMVQTRGMKRK